MNLEAFEKFTLLRKMFSLSEFSPKSTVPPWWGAGGGAGRSEGATEEVHRAKSFPFIKTF